MPRASLGAVRFLKAVNTVVAQSLRIALMVFFAATVGLLFAQVIGRYVFGFSPLWVVETAQYAFVWMSFLGISIAFRRKAHMSIDFLVAGCPPTLRHVLQALVHFLTLAFGVAITYSGFLVAASMRHMLSPGMQISMAWVYSAAPVCGVLAILFELESLVDRERA